MQVQTRHNFCYAVHVTPSYSGRTCEEEVGQNALEKYGLITDSQPDKFYVRFKQRCNT